MSCYENLVMKTQMNYSRHYSTYASGGTAVAVSYTHLPEKMQEIAAGRAFFRAMGYGDVKIGDTVTPVSYTHLQQAISVLYAVAYTLKMSYKTDYKIEGFFEYVVPPLEGFWWQDDIKGVDYTNKSAFNWISVIRLPDFISKADFDWAVETATKKKELDCSSAEYLTIDEGLCVQIMHIGSFDNEPATVALMEDVYKRQGYSHGD